MARGFGVDVASVSLSRLADDVARLPRECLILAARRAKDIAKAEGTRLVGADGMKGKKKRGLRAQARDTMKETASQTNVRIQGSVPAFVWLNTGAKGHFTRRRKRGPKRKLTVWNPGFPGRGAWDRVAAQIEREVPAIFDKRLSEVLHG